MRFACVSFLERTLFHLNELPTVWLIAFCHLFHHLAHFYDSPYITTSISPAYSLMNIDTLAKELQAHEHKYTHTKSMAGWLSHFKDV